MRKRKKKKIEGKDEREGKYERKQKHNKVFKYTFQRIKDWKMYRFLSNFNYV